MLRKRHSGAPCTGRSFGCLVAGQLRPACPPRSGQAVPHVCETLQKEGKKRKWLVYAEFSNFLNKRGNVVVFGWSPPTVSCKVPQRCLALFFLPIFSVWLLLLHSLILVESHFPIMIRFIIKWDFCIHLLFCFHLTPMIQKKNRES